MLELKNLDEQLAKTISLVNEVNEICQNLGKFSYYYEPYIITEVHPNGKKSAKVCIKAFPDKDMDFFNSLTFDEFEDKTFLIRERWETY